MVAGQGRHGARLAVALALWLAIAAQPAAAAAETVAVRENLRVRTLPDVSAPTASSLPARTALRVVKRADDDVGNPWLKLSYRKTLGWVPRERTTKPPRLPCRSRSLGSASSGRLFCGKLLPADTQLWTTRNPVNGAHPNAAARRWGTDSVLAAIEVVSADYWRRFPDAPRLVIGDISLRHGGRFGVHASHQQGRDIDLWYPRRGGGEGLTPRGPGEIDRKRSQWLVERFAAEDAELVYVGVRVGLRRTRSKIRYLGSGHETHFHVRLR